MVLFFQVLLLSLEYFNNRQNLDIMGSIADPSWDYLLEVKVDRMLLG